ncbi:MAG: GlxA family transcriptional regulator [Alphaproteobacteria bacterium]|nr:GlxA family transcriptional regulator [Alphaproteobacteria bacterium]
MAQSNKQKPRRIVMLAFDGAQILDITGPLQILSGVNDALSDGSRAYDFAILNRSARPIVTSSGMRLLSDQSFLGLPSQFWRGVDTLMVTGGEGTAQAMGDADLIGAIRDGARAARRVVSICSGAFLLAQAGLLDGKRATTHWVSAERLAQMFPAVSVDADAIYVRDGRIWTSAGITAGMDLALALVREDFGAAMALKIAQRHVMYVARPGGQSQFSAKLSASFSADTRLGTLIQQLPLMLDQDLSVPRLAERAAMSERNFLRQFRAETGVPPARFIERLRLEAAREMLAASGHPVAHVARHCGFGSPESMRRIFQRDLRISPAAFRARFLTPEERPS